MKATMKTLPPVTSPQPPVTTMRAVKMVRLEDGDAVMEEVKQLSEGEAATGAPISNHYQKLVHQATLTLLSMMKLLKVENGRTIDRGLSEIKQRSACTSLKVTANMMIDVLKLMTRCRTDGRSKRDTSGLICPIMRQLRETTVTPVTHTVAPVQPCTLTR